MSFLGGAEFGWFAPQSAFCFGDFHALPRSHPDEVRLKFGDHGQHVEQQPPDRVVRVVQRSADVEFHFGGGELFDNVAGGGKGAGQAVELGVLEGVTGAAGGEGFAQSGSVPVPSGQAVIDIDPVGLHAEGGECVVLGGEVFGVGRVIVHTRSALWPRPGLYRLRYLHRALKRAGLTGISRTDGQGNSSTLWAGPECSGNRSAIGQPGPVTVHGRAVVSLAVKPSMMRERRRMLQSLSRSTSWTVRLAIGSESSPAPVLDAVSWTPQSKRAGSRHTDGSNVTGKNCRSRRGQGPSGEARRCT